MAERALSLDLDGVVFKRTPYQFKALVRRHVLRKGFDIYQAPVYLPQIKREVVQDQLRSLELPSYVIHMARRVPDDVRSEIISLSGIGVHIYGNTGRSNRSPWVKMTRNSLGRHGLLDYFESIFFKPEGIKTRDSKISAVAMLTERYETVVHIDDNPEDALPMAEMLPNVRVIIVQDKSTGLLYSREESLRYPNLVRVVAFRQGTNILHSAT